jgi:SAM-dependent methyltransferase
MPGAAVFDLYADRYDSWFERHPGLYAAELQALRALLPESKRGIEIGVGSGRFARHLGIRYGVDPALRLLEMARGRGIRTICARAEGLPFQTACFDLVLIVTALCFFDDPEAALKEARRVLLPKGTILMGMIDPDSPPGVDFIRVNKESVFFQEARFYGIEAVTRLLKKVGFWEFEYRQTLHQGTALTSRGEAMQKGYGRGLFVVIKARRP